MTLNPKMYSLDKTSTSRQQERHCAAVCCCRLLWTEMGVRSQPLHWAVSENTTCERGVTNSTSLQSIPSKLQKNPAVFLPVIFLPLPSLVLCFVHGPHSSLLSFHSHKALVKAEIVTYCILGRWVRKCFSFLFFAMDNILILLGRWKVYRKNSLELFKPSMLLCCVWSRRTWQ